VVGVLKRFWVLLEWACVNIFEGGGISFITLFDLRWGWVSSKFLA
jgi:hypothetical protein